MTTKTVRDLKQEIKYQKLQDITVPGAAQLRNSGTPLVEFVDFGKDHRLEVYASGLVLYRRDQHQTVFCLHRVKDMYYSTPEEEKNPLPWHFHLMMVGDDRIFHNIQMAEEKKLISKDEITEDNVAFQDLHVMDPLEALIREEVREEIYRCMTKKQAVVFKLYYEEKMTQSEIAKLINMSRDAVNELLKRARANLRKLKKEILNYF